MTANTNTDSAIGRRLRALREEGGLRQIDVARLAPCSISYLRLLETGHVPCRSRVLPDVLRVLRAHNDLALAGDGHAITTSAAVGDGHAQPSATHGAYAAPSEFLADAAIRPDFAARALARIQAQHDALDHSFEWASLSGLIGAAMRQAEDVAGYSAVLAARIEREADGSTADRRAQALLSAAAQRAAEADLLLELRRLIERSA